jgi:hypothetical protein
MKNILEYLAFRLLSKTEKRKDRNTEANMYYIYIYKFACYFVCV